MSVKGGGNSTDDGQVPEWETWNVVNLANDARVGYESREHDAKHRDRLTRDHYASTAAARLYSGGSQREARGLHLYKLVRKLSQF